MTSESAVENLVLTAGASLPVWLRVEPRPGAATTGAWEKDLGKSYRQLSKTLLSGVEQDEKVKSLCAEIEKLLARCQRVEVSTEKPKVSFGTVSVALAA